MISTEADPSEYYYFDLHLGNVMVNSEEKIKLIDYGATYMCCNNDFSNAAIKCGDLPKCDQGQRQKYHTYTNTFLFMEFVEIFTGKNKTSSVYPFIDYLTLSQASFGLF